MVVVDLFVFLADANEFCNVVIGLCNVGASDVREFLGVCVCGKFSDKKRVVFAIEMSL